MLRSSGLRPRPHVLLASLILLALSAGCAESGGEAAPAAEAAATEAVASSSAVPTFEIDPTWPQEMPDLWVMGSITGVFVDAQDHIWVTHLPETLTPEELGAEQDPPLGTCCTTAPTVVVFDTDGAVVQAWGLQDDDISEYPRNSHGIFVDHNDFVWIGTYRHHRVQKFTRDGELVMTIGEYDETGGSNDPDLLGGPAGIWVDPTDNEVFVADGYGNRRVIVFDGESGEYLRHWGAYGEEPDDTYEYDRESSESPPAEFSTVHGITGSADGRIYVADRRGNGVQVFEQDGPFVDERVIAPETRASGSAFVPVLSPDPDQQWLYMADGTNHKIWILRRSDLEIVGEFGRGGRQLGQFLRPHGLSVDSQGHLYVGEASTGRRVQRFRMR